MSTKVSKFHKTLYVKRMIFQTEVDITGIIVNGLVHRTPRTKTVLNIRKEIAHAAIKCRLDKQETDFLYQNALKMYTKVSKKTWSGLRKLDKEFGDAKNYEESLSRRQNLVYTTVHKDYIQQDLLIKDRNDVAYHYEYRQKHASIWGEEGLFASNQHDWDNYTPFFLCSAHPKPAKDHAEWEGKVYYDENFVQELKDRGDLDNLARVRSYIRNHKLRSAQWVCSEPVFLVTRKNCKHYLTPIPMGEVLHASVKTLLKRHKLIMPEELPISGAIEAYRRYYERFKLEYALNKLIPNEFLTEQLKNDRILIKKWKDKAYLNGKKQ